MNRRKFMKVLLGCSAAMGIPVVGKAALDKPVIAVDPAMPGADHTEMIIGRYEGVRFVETKAYLESTPEGGSFYYDEHQKIKFKSHRNLLQEEMNKIVNARIDNMRLADNRVFRHGNALKA